MPFRNKVRAYEKAASVSIRCCKQQQFSFWLGACPIIGRMVSIVIPASFKPESRPAPKKDFRIMDSGLKTAGMTAS